MIRKSIGMLVTLLAFTAILADEALAVDRRASDDCEQMVDFDRKISGCTRVLESKGLTVEYRTFAYNNRGVGFARKGDLDRAIADFSEALQVNQRNSGAHNNRGCAYYNKGDFDRAIADENEALQIDPKNASAHNNRGLAYLRAFADEAEKADWAMVYYAGHGMEVGGTNYLVPVDAKLAVDRDIQFEAIPLDQVLAAVDTARKLKLVVLDACRDNPFSPRKTEAPASAAAASSPTAGAKITSRSIGRGLAEVKTTSGTLVVFAAKNGQVALDGDGNNSPFAVAMLQRVATPGRRDQQAVSIGARRCDGSDRGAAGALRLRLVVG